MTTQRVFVLGSGFSAAMGLPTLIDLFGEVMKANPRSDFDDKAQVRQTLSALYPHFTSASARGRCYPPFEEFLSLVIAAKELNLRGYDWTQAEMSATRLLTDRLDEISQGKPSAEGDRRSVNTESLRRFTGKLCPGDVIVTFNWDWLIERQLKDVDFVGNRSDAVKLLKLHGSVGWLLWLDEPGPQMPHNAIEFFDGMYHLSDHAYFDMYGTFRVPPFIIPPAYSKRFDGSELMATIWDRAHRALVEADHVFIIGYSIPAEDVHARALLRSGLRLRSTRIRHRGRRPSRYLLVDPDPAVVGKYFSLVSDDLDFLQMRFEDAIDQVLGVSSE